MSEDDWDIGIPSDDLFESVNGRQESPEELTLEEILEDSFLTDILQDVITPRPYAFAGVQLYFEGKFEDALEHFKFAELKNEIETPGWIYAWQGRTLEDLDRLDEAVSRYHLALEHVNSGEIWFYKGYAELELDMVDESIKSLYRAVKLEEDHVDAWVYLGYAHTINAEYDAAIESFNRAILLVPENGSAWNGKAEIAIIREQYQTAIKYANKVISAEENSDKPDIKTQIESWELKERAYTQLNEPALANECARQKEFYLRQHLPEDL